MPAYICVKCGCQYPETDAPPESCMICAGERQFVGWDGQRWTTLEKLRSAQRYVRAIQEVDPVSARGL